MRARGLIADGVDGVRNIGELSGGLVSFRELTVPFGAGCSQYDWAMSLEVGEHIPHEHEHTFLENLNCSCRMGLILSWAQPGQPGAGHVNARRRRSLHALLGEYSLVVQRNATRSLSLAANLTWLRYNVLVFVRGHYTPAPPPPPRPPQPLLLHCSPAATSSSATSATLFHRGPCCGCCCRPSRCARSSGSSTTSA